MLTLEKDKLYSSEDNYSSGKKFNSKVAENLEEE